MMPLASHHAAAGASGITWPKRHVASHFYHFDISNGMVPLMTLLASCDTDNSISGITGPKHYVAQIFQLS